MPYVNWEFLVSSSTQASALFIFSDLSIRLAISQWLPGNSLKGSRHWILDSEKKKKSYEKTFYSIESTEP